MARALTIEPKIGISEIATQDHCTCANVLPASCQSKRRVET